MTGLICAGLLAVGSYHIFISDTARVYSIFVFLTIIVSMYFYETFLTDNASKKNKIIFAAAALFLLYAHLTAAVLLFGQFLYLLIFKKTRTVSWIKTMIIPIVLWLIWAIPSFYFKFTNPSLGQAWYFQISNEWTEKAQSLQPLFTGPSPLYFGLIMMMLFLLAVAFTIFKQRQAKADNPNFKWLIFSAALPIAAMALLNIWNIKFFIISWPFIFIIIGYLLNLYINSNLILITAILVFSLPGLVGLTKILPINDWHQTNAYLNQEYNKNKKQIVIYTHFSDKYHIDRYYTGQIPDMPYYPDSFTGKHDWDFDLITKNYLIHTFPKDETQKWIKEAKLENYTDLYLFYNSRENDNLKKTIEENGWKQAGIFKPRLLEYDELIKYVR